MGMEQPKRRPWCQRIVCFGLVGACMVAIFCFSAQNGTQSDAASLSVAGVLQNVLHMSTQATNFLVRKAAHFSIYLLLSVCLFGALTTYRMRTAVRIAVATGICALYAVSDEFHQSFVSGRTPAVRDVCIDTVGALAGALVFCLCAALWKCFHRSKKLHAASTPHGTRSGRPKDRHCLR